MASNRLFALGKERAAATGRKTVDDSDIDWIASQMKPGEEATFAAPGAFKTFDRGMRLGGAGKSKAGGDTVARKSKAGKGRKSKSGSAAPAKKPGRVRRAARAVAGAVKSVANRIRGRRSAPKTAKRSGARRKSLPPSSGGMVLYTVGADGVAVPANAGPPSSRRKGGKKGGNLANLRPSGKGMAMLTMGGAFIVVELPIVGSTRRSTILLALAGAVTLGAHAWKKPKLMRHAAALTAGAAVGIGAGKGKAKMDEGKT